jgi:hypothetical protein
VDRLGFQTINNQRFGARFVGEVANPSDILMFHQRRRTVTEGDNAGGGASGSKKKSSSKSSSSSSALALPIAPDMDDELNVEDLVAEQLQSSDKKLRLLKEQDLQLMLEVSISFLSFFSFHVSYTHALLFHYITCALCDTNNYSAICGLSLPLPLSSFSFPTYKNILLFIQFHPLPIFVCFFFSFLFSNVSWLLPLLLLLYLYLSLIYIYIYI